MCWVEIGRSNNWPAKLPRDQFWHNRQDALGAVGTIISAGRQNDDPLKLDAATEQVLLKAAKDAKSPVRSDAIDLLNETGDVKFADLYLAALNDQSYNVIDSAAAALGKTESPKAYDALVKVAQTKSWHDRLRIAGLGGLAALADDRAFEYAYKSATDKNLSLNVRTAALEVVGATGAGDARAYPLISEAFKKAVAANNFQGILNSLQGIVNISDPRGQEAFDLLKEKYKNSESVLNLILQYEAEFKKGLNK
jgi:hypothetical protein